MALWRQFTRGLRALVRRSQTDRDLDDEIRQSLALDEADAVYTTPAQWRFADDAMSLVVRTRNDPLALATPVRQAVWAVDKDQPVVRVATMESLLRQSAAERRFALIIFQVFAAAALLLAAAGVYGVLAGSVAERVREFGVRQALGATRREIVSLILRQGAALITTGIAVGVLGAAAASRVLGALLFRVSPLDPVTYAAVVLLMAGVATLASIVPAVRASRVDPVKTIQAG